MRMVHLCTLTTSLFTRSFLTQGLLFRLRRRRSDQKHDYTDKLSKSVDLYLLLYGFSA